MVVQRRAFPYTHMFATAFVELIDLRLQDDTDTFHQEYSAKNRYHQFFVNHHCAYTDDASDSQAARITEEDLCRKTIPPKVTYQCTDKRSKEYHQFFAARYVHHIEILRPDDATARVGENKQGDTYNGRIAGTHAIHAVVQVRTVAYRCNHKHRA